MTAHINTALGDFLLKEEVVFIPERVPKTCEEMTGGLLGSIINLSLREDLLPNTRRDLDTLLEKCILPLTLIDSEKGLTLTPLLMVAKNTNLAVLNALEAARS